MQSGHFPALSALAKQANNTSNRHSSNNSTSDCSEQHAVACPDPPEVPAFAESQPDPFLLVHAPIYAPTAHTIIVEPVHHVAPAQQGQRPKQRRVRRAKSDFTPLGEPLSTVVP